MFIDNIPKSETSLTVFEPKEGERCSGTFFLRDAVFIPAGTESDEQSVCLRMLLVDQNGNTAEFSCDSSKEINQFRQASLLSFVKLVNFYWEARNGQLQYPEANICKLGRVFNLTRIEFSNCFDETTRQDKLSQLSSEKEAKTCVGRMVLKLTYMEHGLPHVARFLTLDENVITISSPILDDSRLHLEIGKVYVITNAIRNRDNPHIDFTVSNATTFEPL